jgi:hypothetical protein
MTAIAKKYPAITNMDAAAAQAFLKKVGDPDMAAAVAGAPDVALRYARFASAGGPSSDAQFNSLQSSLTAPRTFGAQVAAFNKLRDVGGTTLAGMRVAGGLYATRQLRGVIDPGTNNSSRNAAETAAGPGGQPKQRQPGDVINVKGQGQKTITKVYPNGRYDYK